MLQVSPTYLILYHGFSAISVTCLGARDGTQDLSEARPALEVLAQSYTPSVVPVFSKSVCIASEEKTIPQ